MRSSKKQAKQITSAIMAIVMTATTTFQMPVIAMADETMSTAAVESQIEEVTEESSDVSVQNETDAQTSVEATVADTSEALESDSTEVTQTPAAVVESTAEVTCEEEETSLPAEVDPSGEDTEESKANETRGPDDETAETTQIETEVETEAESEAESTSEIETEGSTEAEKADPFAALDPSAGFTEEDLAAIDFSSRRLLIAADPAVIIDPEHVLSSYAGVYLMQYETESQAKYAYAYYYGKSEFVDVDTVISVADGDNSANAAAPMAADENPIAELNEAVAENPVKAAGAIAVIDTGVNGIANVTESVSMIGDNTADENGHGTKMAQLIVEQNPDVSILSIKALGADGSGDVSAVYAAIQYAIDKKVSVINLSMSAVGTAENAALTSIIDAAVEAGIAVVGAAGNKGMDVRFFVPGNIESAYIIGAADENGARIATSNYGSTVDFNVVADSTSEAAAKFSGYYTLNGAVADEKLVFPTDYVKEEKIDYNGPIIKHQISFYNYQGSQDDLVWVGQKKMRTVLDDEYITTYIGFAEDSEVVSRLDVFVDFMSIASERVITDECIVDLENMTVKIPASYKDADLTVRWFMPNASYQYCYDTDSRYMISNTPEKFKVAATLDVSANLSPEVAKSYVAGEYVTGYTHAPESMNHSYITGSTTQFKENEYFTIQAGYIASVEDTIDHGVYYYNGHDEVKSIFGSDALKQYARNPKTKKLYVIDQPTAETFLCHFSTVTRDADNNSDVSSWFNNIGGKGNGVIKVDVDNSGNIDHSENSPEKIDAGIGWLFGTCGNNTIGGSCPSFEAGGKIICTSIGADGTAYFFYYCRSKRAQWAAGSFSITPVLPKTGYLRIHKSSSNPALTDGNSCYSFTNITYKIYSDSSCTTEVQTLYLDQYGYSQPVELTEGTYYIKETDAVNSGYALDTNVYEVTVTAGTTFDAPQTWDTKDAPLNDPFGIVINKINSDGTTAADLSGAEYEINYYAGEYDSVSELPKDATYTWVIKTTKLTAAGMTIYRAGLDDDHVVKGEAVYGKSNSSYVIPLGTITVQETKAPAGFTVKGATVSSAKTGATLSGADGIYLFKLVDDKSAVSLKSGNALNTEVNDETAITLTYAERQINGSPKMEKHDFELNKKAAMGGTNFEGISFEIYCLDDSVVIGNDTYTKGQTITTVTSDAEGNIDVGMQFPVGHYAVREKAANNYYTMTTGQIHYFDIVEYQGEAFIQYESDTNAVTFMDRVVRGDLSFVKKNSDTDEALAYIPFRITNNTTGETHYILTGADGTYTSAVGKTTNTNANDAVLSQYGDKDVIPQSVVDSLAKDAGLWFGMGSEGTMTAANDSYGSFVYGTYTITELKTEATRSMKMYTSTFTIDTDGKVLDLGTVNNVPMGIKTTLVDVNEEHFTEPVSSITLTDHVAYKNLDTDKTYTLTGTLYVKEGDALTELMTETVDFTPAEKNGIQDVTFTFDASALKGKSVVAFEELSVNGEFCAEHKDKDDENQTVTFPDIQTTARDNVTEDHVSNAADSVTIIDTVTYTGLKAGETYEITGTLMDAETGEAALDDDGNAITASKEFTAPSTDGNIDITFTFAGVSLAGKTLVAFEDISYEGRRYAVHADINDKNQTVYIPKIRTNAKDGITDIDHTEALEKATIIDTVSYSSLLPGKEYTVSGTLMNKATGEAVLIDGKPITASTTFTAEKAEGSVDIVFEFDASAIAGTTVVAFESMEYKGIEVAVHADIEDENQTVYIPDVHTKATATDTEDHVTGANKEVTITDEVALTGLKVGNEYTVKGVLMDRNTGAEIQVGGESITDEKTFTAETADMTVTLTYTLDASKLAGTTTVVFETLYTAVTEEMGVEVGRHHDLTDEGQTVYIPEIHTTAADQKTEINHTKSEETATIIDTVHYSHLLSGKEYTVKGVLMNKETGEEVLIDDKPITAETTFTPEKSEGSVDVIFTFDSSLVAPKTVVVFETLEYKGIEIAVHADIEDKDQTVYVPTIKTTAIGEDTEDHIEKAKEDAVIVDTVEYKGLEVGREYVMTGKLVDKVTGEVITDAEGNEITASETFIAEEKDGSIDITFKFDSSALAGKSLVAFESLTTEGKEVAVHADLTDEGQTVRIPEIHTTATDKVTGDHDGVVAKETTVLDEVFYKNLIPGKEYTVSGKLMVKETGEPLTVDGKEVTAEKTFVAEEADGSIILEFTFDSSALAGKKIVAFEDITYEGISIGSHEDLTDDDQTISYPEIHTTAVNGTDGSKTMVLGTNVTLVDTVTYKGLTEGKTYVLKGIIMDKASGQPIGVTAETTFTAEAADGSVEVTFTFDTTQLQGKTLVVFETLYDTQDNQIVDHSDLNDEDQTVTVPVKPQNPPVVTGDDSSPMPYVAALIALLLAAAAVVLVLVRRRRHA